MSLALIMDIYIVVMFMPSNVKGVRQAAVRRDQPIAGACSSSLLQMVLTLVTYALVHH